MKKTLLLLALLPILLFGQFVNYTTNDGLINNSVKSVLNQNSKTYIATVSGLSAFDDTTFVNYTTADGLISNVINCIELDTFGRLWIGAYGGVSVFDGVSFTNFTTAEGLVGANVKDIELDSQGRIWIATANGISVYTGNTFINYTTLDGLPTNSIKSMHTDNNGIMWIGTAVGLCKFNNPGFTVYTTAEGLTSNYVSIFDASDKVYIAQTNGNLSVFDGISSVVYDNSNGLLNSALNGIDIDQNNNVWLAYSDELIKFDLTNIVSYSNQNSILPIGINNINICNTDTFVSTGNGYFKFVLQDYIPHYKYDTLNINNINALVNSNGILFEKFDFYNSMFEVPSGSGLMSNFASTIWLGGINDSNQFFMAGGRFHGNTDWESGPISTNYNTIDYDTTYNRVWKINKSEIDYHILHWNDLGYIIPSSIKLWPDVADYVDFNTNGIYDPENGDYPEIMGDQAILSIFNDEINNATVGRNKMLAEVHALVYGYNDISDSSLYNTVFVQYKIYNRSQNNYRNVYLGVYDDIDIGDALDDYVGVDTVTNSYYIYNGDNSDSQFGTTTPSATSVTFLSSKMTSATYFSGDNIGPPMEAPQIPEDYYNILRGFWKDGTPYTYGGNGYGGTIPVKYVFPGYPLSPNAWNEASVGNQPGVRRGVGIVGPFTIAQGQELCIDVAYINAIAYNYDYLISVKELLSRANYIQWWKSNNPGLSCDSIITVPEDTTLSIFAPNVNVCENDDNAYLFTLLFGGTYPFTYEWRDSAGNIISTVFHPNISIPNTSEATYYVTVTDSLGNTASDSLIVTVNPSPVMNLPQQGLICAGESVEISMPGYYQYQWNNGSTSESATFSSGPLAVLTVTNEYGCSTTSQTDLYFVHQPTELSDYSSACEGYDLTINPGTYESYQWCTGDTTHTITLTAPVTPQTVYLTVTTSDGCVVSDSTIVTLNQPQGVFLGNDTSIAGSDVLVLYPGNYQQYDWIGNNFDPTYTFNGSIGTGSYPVWIDVIDYNGCHSQDTVIITVLTVQISETQTATVKIYPNPTSSYLNIDKGELEVEQATIINILGETVLQNIELTNAKSVIKIDISELKTGTYFLKMKIENKEKTVKFVNKE